MLTFLNNVEHRSVSLQQLNLYYWLNHQTRVLEQHGSRRSAAKLLHTHAHMDVRTEPRDAKSRFASWQWDTLRWRELLHVMRIKICSAILVPYYGKLHIYTTVLCGYASQNSM